MGVLACVSCNRWQGSFAYGGGGTLLLSLMRTMPDKWLTGTNFQTRRSERRVVERDTPRAIQRWYKFVRTNPPHQRFRRTPRRRHAHHVDPCPRGAHLGFCARGRSSAAVGRSRPRAYPLVRCETGLTRVDRDAHCCHPNQDLSHETPLPRVCVPERVVSWLSVCGGTKTNVRMSGQSQSASKLHWF